jgi:hypothetical protein
MDLLNPMGQTEQRRKKADVAHGLKTVIGYGMQEGEMDRSVNPETMADQVRVATICHLC